MNRKYIEYLAAIVLLLTYIALVVWDIDGEWLKAANAIIPLAGYAGVLVLILRIYADFIAKRDLESDKAKLRAEELTAKYAYELRL
jgi:NADH:ubiquinone oxidoreductase subunit 2 (subunit N)